MTRRLPIVTCFVIWAAAIVACGGGKTAEERKAEVAQQASEGWEERLAKLQADAGEKFPDPDLPATATEAEKRVAKAEVAVKRAKWVADWLDPFPKSVLNLADLHVGDKGKAVGTVRVVKVDGSTLIVSYRGSMFAMRGVKTEGHATGHLVEADGYYEATGTGNYGNATLVELWPFTPDAKEKWRYDQAKELLSQARTEEFEARQALKSAPAAGDAPAAKERGSARPGTKPDSKPSGPTATAQLAVRKAQYVRVIAVIGQVEAAATAKFGKTDTIPARAFIDRETHKALDALAKELGTTRERLDAVKMEGDAKGWPTK